MIPIEAIEEFKQIHFETHGIKLNDKEAKQKAENFLELFALITSQNKNKYENNEKLHNHR